MKSFKFRLYPNQEHEQLLTQFFGAKRWIYNHFLSEQKQLWLSEKKHLSHFDMNNNITDLKKQEDLGWLRRVDDWCLKHATEDLSLSYKNFFNSINGKRKGKKMELPRFKQKSNQQSYRTRGIKLLDNSVKLPKIKSPITCVFHQEIPVDSKIKSSTITKTPSGKYFISILTETDVALKPTTGLEVGIDLGLKDLITTSCGIKFQHPGNQILKAKGLLKEKQKQLARKQKGSKNYEKKRLEVAKKYEQITNIKTNYYHNISNWLVTQYDAIYVEDLNVSGMLKNRKLSRAIHESSWSQLSSMIEYKCSWYGKTYYRISRWFPSSKTCSVCDIKLDELSLRTRKWTCDSCGTEHDRDINAAQNILQVGQVDLYGERTTSPATGEEVEIPVALVKYTNKTERSDMKMSVGIGTEQA